MAYTARQLVTDSYYISNIVALDVETVSGAQISRGLNRLNGALATANMNTGLIPYYKTYTDRFISGEGKYYIPYLIGIETMTYEMETTTYSMIQVSRDKFFGSSRVNNVDSLPQYWYLERCNNGANLYVYYNPQSDWEFQINGKFQLEPVTLDTDLEITYEQGYIEYLRYATAKLLCTFYSTTLPIQASQELKTLEKSIKNVSHPDLTCRTINVFPGIANVPNYANVLAHGWTPIR